MPPPQGVSIEIDAREVEQLFERIRRAGRRPTDELMHALAAAGASETEGRIDTGGPGPDGRAWKPVNRPGRPLQLHGHLKDSITDSHTARTAAWGTNLVYARMHQLGGVLKDVRPRNKQALAFTPRGARRPIVRRRVKRIEIPARPYLGFGRRERQAAGAVIERWLDRAMEGRSAR